ncbi:HAMP domain-containing sensor histidine kinase [Nocardioides sp. S5]|uniref:sensor histidine kinase n=1 Tax=Nocardioides sp. S5 TaxID=2017486 RepID=UPI001A90C557|nr:HAMP domain-containing sensor histidine kinase [Nocardioides sp. S5]
MQVATAASFAVLIWLGTRDAHEWYVWPVVRTLSSLGDGVVSVAFIIGAICAAVVTWRRHAGLQRDAGVGDQLEARMAAEIDLAVQASSRDQSERLHELRSTVAGLVNGSALLDNADIPDEARRHLCGSVHRELLRMQRLLAGEHGATTDLDLDETLRLILDLQRLKGRHVELHTSGGTVRARYDSLAEVVNILMDNAATHGGCDTSLVEVVRRDEETVDITVSDNGRGIPEDQRERIFDWGNRGTDSPGQGIGLHVAQRLMAEDGGTLRLAEARGPGSAFVISLPSARRSPENHVPREDFHGAWRISG